METILILDNYDSFTYNLVHYVESISNYKAEVFRNDEISLREVEKYNTIILSPGPGLPSDAGILKELIKTYASTKKILGVCLGMQAIGEVYGGQLINLNTVYHGVADTIKVIQPNDILFKNLPPQFKAGRYHSWVIEKSSFPQELIATSTDENGEIMSLAHPRLKLFGVQFHPESILTEHGKEIITNFLAI